ncbi:MAG TPA: hypothetical protein VGT04_03615 [Acidobacteriaceae bacterium]|nr:hypothetical protein [Acidobacteriaceae bacterium]
MHEEQRVSAGVAVAAVVLGLMAMVGLLIAGFSAFALFIAHSALIPRITSVRVAAGALDVLLFALVILATFTIVGLFRRNSWARYSMIFLGLLDFVVFAIMAAGVLVARVRSGMGAMTLPNNPNVTLGQILLWLAAFCAMLALIGVWWMAYFGRSRMLGTFSGPAARLTQ